MQQGINLKIPCCPGDGKLMIGDDRGSSEILCFISFHKGLKNKNFLALHLSCSTQKEICNCTNETNLGEISIPWEVKAGKIHIRESRVHVHVHICSGVGSAAVQVVLPEGGNEEVKMD